MKLSLKHVMLICWNITYKNLAFRKCVTVYKDIVPSVVFDGCRFLLEREKSILVSRSCFGNERVILLYVHVFSINVLGLGWAAAHKCSPTFQTLYYIYIRASDRLFNFFFKLVKFYLFFPELKSERKTFSSGNKPIRKK